MTEAAPVREVQLPRWVPALLSFVAGYIDSYTFLALFGLFVAQVTGSFVTAGAERVTHDVGIAGKVIAVIAFLLAAALTAGLIGLARERGRDALPWMLAFETVLIAGFCFLMLAGPPAARADDWRAVLAGLFGAAAYGHTERDRTAPDAWHPADQRNDRQHDAVRHRIDRTLPGVAAGRAPRRIGESCASSKTCASGCPSLSRSRPDLFSGPSAARWLIPGSDCPVRPLPS